MARNKYPEETVKLIIDTALKLFVENGYEGTSIQDIINNLGGLSKGAIYHHFKSKEEIFHAVTEKIARENTAYYNEIRDDSSKNGYEKLVTLFKAAYSNPNNDAMFAIKSKIMNEPKFLVNQISEIYEFVVPNYIEPIIREGIHDGSIETDYPKELSEVVLTLFNIWINPLIVKATPDEIERKLQFFNVLLNGIGINILDEETINQCVSYCRLYCD